MPEIISGLRIESSKSRTGKHVLKSTVLIYKKDKGLLSINKHQEAVVGEEQVKPTYRRGWAKKIDVKLDHGDYLIHIWFVKNLWGKVKGYISIYNHRGELVYRAKYVDGDLRRSTGDPIYAWLVRLVAQQLKIPVKRTRLGDEKNE